MSALPSSPATRGHGAPRGPLLRLVEHERPVGRYVAALTLITALGVFGIVGLNAVAAGSAFQARSLEDDVRELTLRYDELTADVARLESPERVREIATGQLGMVAAEQPRFLIVPARPGNTPADGRRLDVDGNLADGSLADPVKQALGSRR